MKFLLPLLLSITGALAQAPEGKPAKYRTEEEIKVFWANQFVIPPKLDQSHKAAIQRREYFLSELEAGNLDLLASKTAASCNLLIAMEVGDATKADQYRTDVAIYEREVRLSRKTAQQKELMTFLDRLGARIAALKSQVR